MINKIGSSPISVQTYNWIWGRLRSPQPGVAFSISAFLATLCFFVGMALLGTHSYAGYFYLTSILLGTPAFFVMRPWETDYSGTILIYLTFYISFVLLCVVHVFFWDASAGTIEYAARFVIGFLNGFFFFTLFGGNRTVLFRFVFLVAGAHATVAIFYTLHAGFDFVSLARSGPRVGGNTNPIPYSMLFLTSAGIVALMLTNCVRPNRKYFLIGAISLVLGGSLLAGMVSDSRGTLITLPLLLVLIAAILWRRVGMAWSIGVFAAFLVVMLVGTATAFQRDPMMWAYTWDLLIGQFDSDGATGSVGIRYQLWHLAAQLIPEAPLLGHGFSSVPEVLRHEALNVPPGSILFQFNHVHNEYLDILLKAGIVGAILYFGPMMIALWAAWRILRKERLDTAAFAVFWVVGAQLIYGMTSVTFAHASTTLQLGVYLGMLINVVQPSAQSSQNRP